MKLAQEWCAEGGTAMKAGQFRVGKRKSEIRNSHYPEARFIIPNRAMIAKQLPAGLNSPVL